MTARGGLCFSSAPEKSADNSGRRGQPARNAAGQSAKKRLGTLEQCEKISLQKRRVQQPQGGTALFQVSDRGCLWRDILYTYKRNEQGQFYDRQVC